MCLAIAFTYKYENVGIHTAGMDIEIYGGFGNPTSDKITINPTPHEDISVHIYDYWSAGADYYIPVVDNSYRSLRRTVGEDMDYAICIDQPDRVLSVYDVQKCLGLSEDRLKIIRYSPAIQRACDAGLITRRMSDAEGMWSACFAIADEITNNSHTV
jgi:hypothetical protein